LSAGRRVRSQRGHGLIEMALILPLLLLVAFGVVESGYALLDQHVVTKITREGSNLISRDTTLQDAMTAMRTMSTSPVDLDANSRLIFTVIKKGATTGTANFDHEIVYQRLEFGALSGVGSRLATQGPVSVGPAPDYVAFNSDTNANLRITNLPANIELVPGGLLYVTELYTQHQRITPLELFGITFPEVLYSAAYF
jgi:Flp pilus assembly protein TadG